MGDPEAKDQHFLKPEPARSDDPDEVRLAARTVTSFDGIEEHQHSSASDEDPLPPFPTKHFAIALFLLVVGIVCLSIGLQHLFTGQGSAFPLLIIGAITTIPGVYQLVMIYKIWRRRPGWTFTDLPGYEHPGV